MTRTTRIATALLVAAGMTVTAAPAHAATWQAQDPQGDVVRLPAAEDDVSQAVPAPQRRAGDVTGLSVDHRRARVLVTLDHDRLVRPTRGTQVVHVLTVRAKGQDRDVALVTDRAHPQGQLLERPCRATRAEIDYRAARVSFTVPSRCLGSPRAVRVGGATGTLAGQRLLVDDALLDGRITDEAELGPRVPVG